MEDKIIKATIEALKCVKQERFFRTERGYQGRFYCGLQTALDRYGILNNETILEMEYQKSSRHGVTQRPDIIIHKPAELYCSSVQKDNLAVFALKHQASVNEAKEDFVKLDEMIEKLHYKKGIFINIDSSLHHLDNY